MRAPKPSPLWVSGSPPDVGPWRVRYAWRPSGESGLGVVSYTERSDADDDALAASRHCRQGCTYDVVPDPGGTGWTFP